MARLLHSLFVLSFIISSFIISSCSNNDGVNINEDQLTIYVQNTSTLNSKLILNIFYDENSTINIGDAPSHQYIFRDTTTYISLTKMVKPEKERGVCVIHIERTGAKPDNGEIDGYIIYKEKKIKIKEKLEFLATFDFNK